MNNMPTLMTNLSNENFENLLDNEKQLGKTAWVLMMHWIESNSFVGYKY